MRPRELTLLMTAAQSVGGEATRIEAGDRVGLIAQRSERAEDPRAELAPRRGDDVEVGVGSVGAVERGGLVIDVHDPDRDDEQADAKVERAPPEVVEERLLDFDLALIAGRRDRVLDFQLGVEAESLGEVVADEQNEAAEIDRGGLLVVGRVEDDFAVAADRRAGAVRALAERNLDLRLAGEVDGRRLRHRGLRFIGGRGQIDLRLGVGDARQRRSEQGEKSNPPTGARR